MNTLYFSLIKVLHPKGEVKRKLVAGRNYLVVGSVLAMVRENATGQYGNRQIKKLKTE